MGTPLDVETLLLIGAALVGIVVGVLHLVGYVPPRYRKMLREVQASTATAITEALEAQISRFAGPEGEDGPDPLIAHLEALESKLGAFTPDAVGDAIASRLPVMPDLTTLPAAIGAEVANVLGKMQAEAMAEFAKAEAIPPEVTGAMGGTIAADHRRTAELKNAIGEGILGPYGGILQQVMPPLYDYLSENPDMALQALQMPVVQKLIQQGARMLGKVTGGDGSQTQTGWG